MTVSPAEAVAPSLLSLRGISKTFGKVPVLREVDFDVREGEVHALVGENGAGKSTLMNIIAGALRPDSGSIEFRGQPLPPLQGTRHAQAFGIATVFQERTLFPDLTVAENILAGRQPVNRFGVIDRAGLGARAAALLSEVGIDISPDALADELGPGEQQLVEVAKALSLDARVVVFDEPTAALTGAECARLFDVIRFLRNRGAAVIYISHRLEEIFHLAQRVTVLRDGCRQATLPTIATDANHLVRLMVGRDIAAGERRSLRAKGALVLEVDGLRDQPSHGRRRRLEGISFSAHAGEILGLAGLAGSGRSETALTIIGARRRGEGVVRLHGKPFAPAHPGEAVEAGIGYLPEDRKTQGIFPNLSVAENVAAAGLRRFGTWWLRGTRLLDFARRQREALRIVCRDTAQPIEELSGGNQQKCILARWLLVRPGVLIVDEPTRGVDVGAKAEVHALLRELADEGTAVVVISSELPEVLSLADRIVVLREGRTVGELAAADASEERIMQLAAVSRAATPAP